jgi:hypothetical protein
MMRNLHRLVNCVAICATLVAGAAANAAVIPIQLADAQRTFDYEAVSDATAPSQGVSNDLRTGVTVVNARLASTILPFPLPALAPGEQIVSALLTVNSVAQAAANVPLDFNADLYGLPLDPAAGDVDITNARHFTGALDPAASPTGSTRLLQDNFLVPLLAPTTGPDIPVTSVDISGYISSLYAGGAVAGDFAILRLSSDSTSAAELRRFRIRSAGGTGSAANPTTRPLLTIITAPIPEPSTLALAGVLFAAPWTVRRRGADRGLLY